MVIGDLISVLLFQLCTTRGDILCGQRLFIYFCRYFAFKSRHTLPLQGSRGLLHRLSTSFQSLSSDFEKVCVSRV